MLIALVLVIQGIRNKLTGSRQLLRFLPFAIALPYIANTAGWMLTEMGRQPWVVFGLLKTADASSPNVSPGMVLASLILFALVYGVLMVADVFLLQRFAKEGPVEETAASAGAEEALEY